jgi:hypothetical protein
VLLALDLGTRVTGFAFGPPEANAPKSGAYRLPGADDLVQLRMMATAGDSVSSLCKLIKPTHVCIEAPIVVPDRSAHTMTALMQLTGVVRTAIYRVNPGIRETLRSSQTIRKHFCGHGRPENPKTAVMEKCRLLGWQVETSDAADACAAWSYGIGYFFGRGVHTELFRGAA